MLRKLQALAVLSCMLSYAAAGTASIGTASARGDLRVDSYTVKGNATLFEGSVVETGQATADLRLNKGTEITMSTGSRGTLHSDRLVLQQGEGELSANSSFKIEASGLQVTPSEPNSRGVVSLKAGNRVEVAALNGSFGVTNDHGILLGSVRPGRAISFAMSAAGRDNASDNPSSFSATGVISCENGHYFIATDMDPKTGVETRYELTGKDLKRYVGKKVEVVGVLVPGAIGAGGATGVVSLSTIGIVGAGAISGTTLLIIGGVAVAAGVGIGLGVYYSNQSTPSTSQ